MFQDRQNSTKSVVGCWQKGEMEDIEVSQPKAENLWSFSSSKKTIFDGQNFFHGMRRIGAWCIYIPTQGLSSLFFLRFQKASSECNNGYVSTQMNILSSSPFGSSTVGKRILNFRALFGLFFTRFNNPVQQG